MTAALIASDLDRTLIYSRRFFESVPPESQCVEVYQGQPISYMTRTAMRVLQELAADQIVVPATTRTVVQYRRVTLPGAPYRFAVTSNGGSILVDGEPDQCWSAEVSEQIRSGGASIDTVTGALRGRLSEQWVRSQKVAEGLFCYLVVDESSLPDDFLDSWQEWCTPRGWRVSRQGHKIYTVPQMLCKSRAVAEVRRRLVELGELGAGAPVFASGDGALDAELLNYADEAIRPAHGELHALGWCSDHTTVTALSGAGAAEEILAWLRQRAATEMPPTAQPAH